MWGIGVDTLVSSAIPVDPNLPDLALLDAEAAELQSAFPDPLQLGLVIQFHQLDTFARDWN